MPKEQTWEQKIQELIDDFPDDQYLELLEIMIDLAETSKAAKEEEMATDE